MKLTVAFILFICSLDAQDIQAVKFDVFQKMIDKTNDTLYVVNFWATWCSPCIEELPYFNQLTEAHGKKLKIFTVSVDYKSKLESVRSFLKKRPLLSETLLLDESDPNIYIDRINSEWSGAIPATVLFQNGKRVRFTEKKFENFEELKSFTEPFLKP